MAGFDPVSATLAAFSIGSELYKNKRENRRMRREEAAAAESKAAEERIRGELEARGIAENAAAENEQAKALERKIAARREEATRGLARGGQTGTPYAAATLADFDRSSMEAQDALAAGASERAEARRSRALYSLPTLALQRGEYERGIVDPNIEAAGQAAQLAANEFGRYREGTGIAYNLFGKKKKPGVSASGAPIEEAPYTLGRGSAATGFSAEPVATIATPKPRPPKQRGFGAPGSYGTGVAAPRKTPAMSGFLNAGNGLA